MTLFEIASSAIASEALHSLRYELAFVAAFLVLLLLARLAGLHGPQSEHGLKKPLKVGTAAQKLAKTPPSEDKRTAQRRLPATPPTEAGVDSLGRTARFGASAATAPGRLHMLEPAQLKDPAFVVPHVTNLCRTQVQNALAVYRAAIQAGLQLHSIPASECRQLALALLTSCIRVSQVGDAIQVLRDLREHGVDVSVGLFSSATKLCTAKQLFAECLTVYDFVAEDPDFVLTDKSICSCLLFCAVEAQAYHRCNFFFERLKACGTPSSKDFGNMVRLASLHGDWKLALQLVGQMREVKMEIDNVMYNTALAICVSNNQVDQARALLDDMAKTDGIADVITYNTLMKGYAKAGRVDQCFEVFELLQARGLAPSQVTYGILLDGCINENQLDRAAQVFSTMSGSGCIMNTVLYTTLIKGFSRAGEVDMAMKVFEQMRSEHSVKPDLITFSILIKANCDADRLDVALKLLESMVELGLRPDEVVFNNLIAGCAKQARAELGRRLYSDMIASDIKPSNATFSIMIRLFHQCKALDEAVELLRVEPTARKVEPEPRLFLQLIQSCIRDRQGRRAVDVYELLWLHSAPTAAAHASMLGTCFKLNMYDTAAEILTIASKHAGRVDAQDAQAVYQGALKKGKTQVAQECAEAMRKLGIPVDSSQQKAGTSSRKSGPGGSFDRRQAPANNAGAGATW